MSNPVTERQLAFIRSLAAERTTALAAAPDVLSRTVETTRDASQMIDILLALPRDAKPTDPAEQARIDALREALPRLAGGDAAFAASLISHWDRKGSLSEKQWPHVDRLAAAPEERAVVTEALPDVPSGHYAVPSTGDNDLAFYRVDRPTEGRWAGRTFVKIVIGGRPDTSVPRRFVPGILARIVDAGIEDAARLYGREIGRCCLCNRHLTDEVSRSAGVGPDCAGRL